MKRSILRTRGWWIAAGLVAAGLAPPAPAGTWQGRAEIEFRATSTLHDFSGTVQTEPFTAIVAMDGSHAMLAATATVSVAEMDTRHAKRDANMRKMFDAVGFPLVTGVVEPIRIDPATRPQVPILLTIRDRTQTVPATLADWRMEKRILRFDLDMVLSLKKSGLSPPVLMGFIKVGDAVFVRIRVELEQAAALEAGP